MATARLDIAYDGRRFAGWAVQPGQRTVQGEIEDAAEQILGARPVLTVAGRTDAGVHALGQVASFEHPESSPLPDRLAERLNAVLARDVAVTAAAPAPDGFDARRDARSRTYRYRVLASAIRRPHEEGRALWWRYPLDRPALDAAAESVVGSHDFTAFTPTQTEHRLFERNVDVCRWQTSTITNVPLASSAPPPGATGSAEGSILELEITAPSFMRNQVRVLVGTMLEVAGGRRSLEDFAALLGGAPRERAGDTAPAHGLYLASVSY